MIKVELIDGVDRSEAVSKLRDWLKDKNNLKILWMSSEIDKLTSIPNVNRPSDAPPQKNYHFIIIYEN